MNLTDIFTAIGFDPVGSMMGGCFSIVAVGLNTSEGHGFKSVITMFACGIFLGGVCCDFLPIKISLPLTTIHINLSNAAHTKSLVGGFCGLTGYYIVGAIYQYINEVKNDPVKGVKQAFSLFSKLINLKNGNNNNNTGN